MNQFEILKQFAKLNGKIDLSYEDQGKKKTVSGQLLRIQEWGVVILGAEQDVIAVEAKDIRTFRLAGATSPITVIAEIPDAPEKIEQGVLLATHERPTGPGQSEELPTPLPQSPPAPNPPTPSGTVQPQEPPPTSEIPEYIFDQFSGPVAITLPEPRFLPDNPDLYTMSGDEREVYAELNKCKNKYEYATKMKELNRIRDFLPGLIRQTGSHRRAEIFLLCGLLSIKINDTEKARTLFSEAFRLGDDSASLGLAHLSVQEKDWESAAKYLCRFVKRMPADNPALQQEILLNIGRCISNLSNKELPGLAAITLLAQTPLARRTSLALLAFSLRERFLPAAKVALQGNLELARSLASGSPVFDEADGLDLKHHEPALNLAELTRDLKSQQQILSGHISSVFPDRWFGFLSEDSRRTTYFFRFSSVEDQVLRTQVTQGIVGQTVLFTRAVHDNAPQGRYEAVEQIKRKETGYTDYSEVVVPTSSPVSPFSKLPKGSSPYAKAKRVEQDGDYETAKTSFMEEISQQGPRWLSAVKDLAALHNRLREFDEGIAILDKYRKSFASTISLDNLKATILLKANRYEQAAGVFSKLKRETTGVPQRNYIRQQAYCLFALGKFDEALALLRAAPPDPLTTAFIEKIKQYREQGLQPNQTPENSYFDELIGFSSGFSAFTKYLLSTCDFRRVDDRSKARGYYDEQDIQRLERQRDALRGRVPKERAEISLTIAAICQEAPEAAGERTVVENMRLSLSHLGEMALNDSFPRDTARCYFAEAIALASTRVHEQDLTYLLATYLSALPAPGELLSKEGRVYLNTVLKRFDSDASGWNRFQRDFPYYGRMSDDAVRFLSTELTKSRAPANFLKQYTNLNEALYAEEDRCRREKSALDALAGSPLSVGVLQDMSKTLAGCAQNTRFELDRLRLTTVSRVMADVARYWQDNDYIEREAKFGRVTTELDTITEEIRTSPTKLSVESLLPICHHLEKQIKQNFKDFQANAKPDFEVTNLLKDDYFLLKDGCLTVRLEIFSKPGGAPIEALEVIAEEENGLSVEEAGVSPEVLRSGERREIELKIKPSRAQVEDQTFTLLTVLRYRTRAGQNERSAVYPIPIRLSLADSFVPIANPYGIYAGGKVVEKHEMFFGRADLVKRIEEYVLHGPVGQCFVLYGQKRSGKSSVVHQVEQRITHPNLAVSLTVGAINTEAAERSFIQTCLDSLQMKVVDRLGFNLATWPSMSEVHDDPVRAFRQAVMQTIRTLKENGWHEPRIVLLIDEFTYLFEYITEKLVSPGFMRNWKALLQLNTFSAVVVGQDSMTKFKQAYANEFGVTYDERITYLSEHDALSLAVQPILLDEKTRYRGNKALPRLLELTAGSPFYLQIMCDRLVRYLNKEKAPFITEADINNVARELTVGNDRLPIERFDPLITAAGESVAEADRETYLGLLTAIANTSTPFTGANLADLPVFDNRDFLLKDMTDRDVIEFDIAGRMKIRVGLFAEWLRSAPTY
ncbi:MAG: hypothetical protein HYR56_18995 [Acidobacteria bacterium]|nr:hypothetical protein [Acidobacteriota bacterium]MBI3427245.1 hypothetical protein [Acidobacteriota bacterium]